MLQTLKVAEAMQHALLAVSATTHLWGYLNATSVRCPSCKRDMQLNWGWCPYHPIVENRPYALPDRDKSGGWNDEFIEALLEEADSSPWLVNKVPVGRMPIARYLKEVPSDVEARLFVHCSEFIVIK